MNPHSHLISLQMSQDAAVATCRSAHFVLIVLLTKSSNSCSLIYSFGGVHSIFALLFSRMGMTFSELLIDTLNLSAACIQYDFHFDIPAKQTTWSRTLTHVQSSLKTCTKLLPCYYSMNKIASSHSPTRLASRGATVECVWRNLPCNMSLTSCNSII